MVLGWFVPHHPNTNGLSATSPTTLKSHRTSGFPLLSLARYATHSLRNSIATQLFP
jgi:hypothetical protein